VLLSLCTTVVHNSTVLIFPSKLPREGEKAILSFICPTINVNQFCNISWKTLPRFLTTGIIPKVYIPDLLHYGTETTHLIVRPASKLPHYHPMACAD